MALKDAGRDTDRAFTGDLKGGAYENAFAGALSFMRRRYTKDMTEVDLAITGIPFDQATTNRPGARIGPRAIREASSLLPFDPPWGWGFDPLSEFAVADAGDMAFDYAKPAEVPARIKAHATALIEHGTGVIALGGDHSVSRPLMEAHAESYGPLSLVQFDAHSDTWPDDDPDRNDHGTMFYKAVKDGVIDPASSVQVGIRTHNADTLGIRPDLIGRPISNWSELLNPEFKGKAAILDISSIGIMDMAMVVESMGEYKYPDKGNMTREEIDLTIGIFTEAKKNGQFRAFWKSFDESVNLMASGEVVIQSMWSPAITAVRSQGIPCVYQPLEEGYRSWGGGMGLAASLEGAKLDAAYEYINWYLSGWVGGFLMRQGYYSAVPETSKLFMSDDEWGFWYEGKESVGDIVSPSGQKLEGPGVIRDGGSFLDRMGAVACWNSVMDENQYMVRKWNEFIAA